MLLQTRYHDIRTKLKNGDIIAFGGKGLVSSLIKLFTRSPVSHVAVVMCATTDEGLIRNQIIESTSLNGVSGVSVNRLSNRIKDYDGDIWILPLKKDLYFKTCWKSFYKYMLTQKGKEYDTLQAIGSKFDIFWNNDMDMSKFFCSELVVDGFNQVGILENILAPEVTPIDLCMATLFDIDYYQVKGDIKEIKKYNTVNLGDWVI